MTCYLKIVKYKTINHQIERKRKIDGIKKICYKRDENG